MRDRLERLMKREGLNTTRLAAELGVQASGISHIMGGRNKPSFDFVTKLLLKFPQLNPDWLLLGQGPMYRDEIKKSGTVPEKRELFSTPAPTPIPTSIPTPVSAPIQTPTPAPVIPQPPQHQHIASEPDNDDLIPGPPPAPVNTAAQAWAARQSMGSASSIPVLPPPAGYVERIVVFYHDKTFTEYRPESE